MSRGGIKIRPHFLSASRNPYVSLGSAGGDERELDEEAGGFRERRRNFPLLHVFFSVMVAKVKLRKNIS